MTHTEIMNMQAGQEMDTIVAVEIMGWKWFRADPDYAWWTSIGGKTSCVANTLKQDLSFIQPPDKQTNGLLLETDESRKVIKEYKPMLGEWAGWMRPPNYSTSIAGAWKVVEKLSADGTITCWNFTKQSTGNWMLGIGRDGLFAATPPLAICRAALLTKETSDE